MRKGKAYEERAVEYLKKKGYRILERNYRCRGGEVDVIALDGEEVVFVEVKGGRTEEFGHPAERFTKKKLKRILSCAWEFMEKRGLKGSFRVDLIVVFEGRVEHMRNVGIY